MAGGDVDSIWDGIDEAREVAARTPSGRRNEGFVQFVEAMYALSLLEPDRCIESADRNRALFPDHAEGFLCDAYKAMALLSSGRPDEAATVIRSIRPRSPLSPYGHVPIIVEILVSAVEVGPDEAARALTAMAPESLARQPLTVGDWLIGFAWLACERGDFARARALVVDTKHHSLALSDVWRRALGWPDDGQAAFRQWTADNPWSDVIARAVVTQPRLIAEELARWGPDAP